MDRAEIRSKVVGFLVELEFTSKVGEIEDTATFGEDLNMDSLDVIELLIEIESELAIEIPDWDLHLLKTVGALVDYIDKNMVNPS